ncbi:putative ATP-dependent RNA helicase DDX27 [Hypsibius exemplaris]|uniref:RNA helicase n=1 Tax=Hypsibius exemplaris TaxID=2072580 RepID=A0A1W0WQ07_HYPEX|nr:putative ATP-dependent RNA helicase DDX27 [Hypsibius exemplaris]
MEKVDKKKRSGLGKSNQKKRKAAGSVSTAKKAPQEAQQEETTDVGFADSFPIRTPHPEDAESEAPEEQIDDAFDEGFDLFKQDSGGYLEDTWGDVSRGRFKRQKEVAADSAAKPVRNVADWVKTKERKVPKSKKGGAGEASGSTPVVEVADPEEIRGEDMEKDNMETGTSFQEMNLSRPILKALSELNFTTPTPIQASAIPVGLLGRDICACSRTGTGKTAAYMLPILERLHYKPKADVATRVLVLVPTRELGAQVCAVTKDLLKFLPEYIQVALVVGGLDMKKQEKELREMPDIVIATPGRLLDHIQHTPSFGLSRVEVLVLDEADRMLDEFFAEQMNEIIKLCAASRQTMLFSATLTEEVQKLASISLKDPVKLMVDESASVALALRQEFVRVRDEESREALLLALLCRSFPERTLVFIPTKVQVHRLCVILKLLKMKAGELHGNLSQLQRLAALDDFKESKVDILLATDVAARGLDIPFVKTVINLALPNTLEQYVHRVGRTARAGRVGRSVSLVGEDERKLLKIIVKNARLPVQNRVIPPEIITSFWKRIASMETDIEAAMNAEKEEKAMERIAKDIETVEAHLAGKKAEPVIQRKPLPGFASNKKASKKWRKEPEQKKKSKVKKEGRSDEDKSLSHFQKGQARKSKKESRPQRMRAADDRPNFKLAGGRPTGGNQKKKGASSFATDLADTRKKGVKRLNKIGGNRPNDKRSQKLKAKVGKGGGGGKGKGGKKGNR